MLPNKSTGPRTPEGKAIASQNSFKHGLAARRLFIPGEDPTVFFEMHESYQRSLQPDGTMESELIEEMAIAKWLKDRAIRLQTLAFEKLAAGSDPHAVPAELQLYIRYQTNNENIFYRAFKMLQALQKERKAEGQSVSQQRFEPRHEKPYRPWPGPVRVARIAIDDLENSLQPATEPPERSQN